MIYRIFTAIGSACLVIVGAAIVLGLAGLVGWYIGDWVEALL